MRVLVGTSGWNYDPWRGPFYPEDLAKTKWLGWYASRFPTVEINYSYYRIPTEKTLRDWAAGTPESFRFALKASQKITHEARLDDAGEVTTFFCERTRLLGEKLGPILFQLPPSLKKDAERLRTFLAGLPAGTRAAFEFRHASWFDEETWGTLRGAGAAVCVADSEDLETPLVATAPWGYLRLRREDYADADLDRWAERIRGAGWTEDVHVYFKHEDAARGPQLADALIARLG